MNKKHKYKQSKTEHLISKKAISVLFENGKRDSDFPLFYSYIKTIENQDVKVLFSVSKKNFKKAVLRNYHKRLLREAYRLNKNELFERVKNKDFGLNIVFSVTGMEKLNFYVINEKIKLILKRIMQDIDD